MRMITRILPVLMFLVFAAGCSGKGGAGESKEKWPAKPADGAPLVVEFVKLVGADKDMQAELKLFNFEAKAVRRLFMTTHFLDASGKELKDFPWSVQAPEVVGAKKTAVIKAGAFLPKETVSVKVTLREVEFTDGSKWEAENAAPPK